VRVAHRALLPPSSAAADVWAAGSSLAVRAQDDFEDVAFNAAALPAPLKRVADVLVAAAPDQSTGGWSQVRRPTMARSSLTCAHRVQRLFCLATADIACTIVRRRHTHKFGWRDLFTAAVRWLQLTAVRLVRSCAAAAAPAVNLSCRLGRLRCGLRICRPPAARVFLCPTRFPAPASGTCSAWPTQFSRALMSAGVRWR
jgi:hypothetical protein